MPRSGDAGQEGRVRLAALRAWAPDWERYWARYRAPLLALALGLAPLAQPVAAQIAPGPTAPPAEAPAPLSVSVVTLDQQALFSGSAFGRRALADLEAARAALIVESDLLAEELGAAERALTEARPGLAPEEFRARADAFDALAEEVRARQDAKDKALLRALSQEQQRFYALATAPLADLAREIGAVAILSPQAVLLTVGPIDITDLAIARLDARLGDGSDPPGDDGTAQGPGEGPRPDLAAPDAPLVAPDLPGGTAGGSASGLRP